MYWAAQNMRVIEPDKAPNVTKDSRSSGGDVLKGCGTGPWLVHVCPCFRENIVATCKIGVFFCVVYLDNLPQKT